MEHHFVKCTVHHHPPHVTELERPCLGISGEALDRVRRVKRLLVVWCCHLCPWSGLLCFKSFVDLPEY